MFFWFLGVSVVAVWLVFQSPALDYRVVMLGSVLPLVELVAGRPLFLHTLAGAVVALGLVMAVTVRRRLLRRRWLGIPIGLFVHLVLDGVWTDTALFWWPFAGPLPDEALPEISRGVWSLALEVVGLAAGVWWVRRFQLTDRDRLRTFLRDGRLGRDLVS
ncbi:MAG: hypothetical protein S0880_26315 [Actinomycetota bacterium]|nr:hypothetical protein [Actinomycetota bacterium]